MTTSSQMPVAIHGRQFQSRPSPFQVILVNRVNFASDQKSIEALVHRGAPTLMSPIIRPPGLPSAWGPARGSDTKMAIKLANMSKLDSANS